MNKFILILCVCLGICYPCLSPALLLAQEPDNIKKAVMVIAQKDFQDEEFLQTKEILEKNNIEVKVASASLDEATGMSGTKVAPNIKLGEINPNDFVAVIFIGGQGIINYWDDPQVQALAQSAFSAGKAVGAICLAPVILAKAGILNGRRATVWYSEAQQLKSAGAIYTGNPVERDANIITATGPTVAKDFAEEILYALQQKE